MLEMSFSLPKTVFAQLFIYHLIITYKIWYDRYLIAEYIPSIVFAWFLVYEYVYIITCEKIYSSDSLLYVERKTIHK